jgi:hypothetical protein
MREIRQSGSMRGCRKRAATYRACVLLYRALVFSKNPFLMKVRRSWCASFAGRTSARVHDAEVCRAWH